MNPEQAEKKQLVQGKEAFGYKDFKCRQLFELKSNPQLDKIHFNFVEKGYPYFTRTSFNNGILGNVEYLDNKHKIKGNSLAIGMIEMKFHYMEKDFYAGQFTKTAFPKFKEFNKNIAFYFISLLSKFQPIYQGVLVRDFEELFYNTTLSLPITPKNEIDFEYMETRIRELEFTRIRELATYLKITGLSDYILTDDDRKFMGKLGGVKYSKFKIGDIFNSAVGDYDIQQKHINGKGIYVVNSGETDTGIKGKSDIKARIFHSNTITVDMFGLAYYRGYDYKMATHGHVFSLSLKQQDIMTREIGLYIVSAMKHFKQIFSFSNMLNWNKIKEETLYLPITEKNTPDYDFMSKFIRIQEKLAIKKVVEYNDKIIQTTKEVVGA